MSWNRFVPTEAAKASTSTASAVVRANTISLTKAAVERLGLEAGKSYAIHLNSEVYGIRFEAAADDQFCPVLKAKKVWFSIEAPGIGVASSPGSKAPRTASYKVLELPKIGPVLKRQIQVAKAQPAVTGTRK